MMSPPERRVRTSPTPVIRSSSPTSSLTNLTTSSSHASTSNSTLTLTETEPPRLHEPAPSVRLVLKKPKNSKKVNWTTETVDNEHMDKRKSKCCCIYKKPHVFGESSSESEEDECENCYGHCELRKPPPPPPPSVPPVS
ncbi:E3 ubiquitin-protein ligase PPP1R11 [Folsomia candida]|uniref:E3 ubiquitin-protein ligase PPP1R11 n=1 Tax=Folsomia candida TaxID=158441 RepID=A0A226D219_FOLCA|nr:E3 ubiquitin-protein ligase PPP1R11 [Folsomia candida]OXA38914.1 hypothetical protein Fcan01_26232 [Folsomia candida]